MKSKIFNVAKSTIVGIMNSIILLLLNLLSRKLFLQYIGLEYLSVAQVISNLVTVFSFAELGLSNSVLYMLYNPIAKADKKAVTRILWLYRRFNRYVGITIGMIGVLFAPFLHLFIKTTIPLYTIYIVYSLYLFSSVSTYFYSYRSVLLGANQKDYIASLISLTISFFRICIQCILIYITHSYFVYLVTGIIATVIQNATIYALVGKKYPYIKERDTRNESYSEGNKRKELKKNVFSMASVKIAGIIINNTDNILVSWIDTLMVGLCANYTTISLQIKSLISIFHSALLHSIGIACVEKNADERYKLFKEILLINTYVCGLSAVCLGVLWNDFIIIWLGEKYVIDNLIFLSLLLNFTWGTLTAPIWLFRDANGLFIYVKKILLVNAVLNIILSLLLGLYIGVSGVFIATLASDILTDFWFDSNLIYRKTFDRKNGIEYQCKIIESLITIFTISFIINCITKTWSISFIIWMVKGILTGVIYTAFFWVRNRNTFEYNYIMQKYFLPSLLTKYVRRK